MNCLILINLELKILFTLEGTLTTNRMTVVQCYMSGQHFSQNAPTLDQVPVEVLVLMATGISVNSSYTSKILVSGSSLFFLTPKLFSF